MYNNINGKRIVCSKRLLINGYNNNNNLTCNIIYTTISLNASTQCARNVRIEHSPPVVWSVRVRARPFYKADPYRQSKLWCTVCIDLLKVCALLVNNGVAAVNTYLPVLGTYLFIPNWTNAAANNRSGRAGKRAMARHVMVKNPRPWY